MSRDKTGTVKTRTENQIVVGLDVGSSKIKVVIGEIVPDSDLPNIVGVGESDSGDENGINAGAVLNVRRAAAAIQKAVAEAEKVAGVDVRRVTVGIAARSSTTMEGNGQITISKTGDRELTQTDRARVIEQSSAIQLPSDREILDVIPNEYMLDGNRVPDPCGCTGVRLEAKVQLVLVNPQNRDNLFKAVECAELEVAGYHLGTLACAEAVLSEEEKDAGVVLIDLGSSSTNIAVFVDGTLRYAHAIPFGGDTVTRDLAVGLHANEDCAEEIKCMHGACRISQVEDCTVKVPGIGNRPAHEVKRSELVGYIEPRIREIFEDVGAQLDAKKVRDKLVAGAVLVGGGASLFGIKELAAEVLKLPVEIGVTQTGTEGLRCSTLKPCHTEGIGLVHLAAKAARQTSKGNSVAKAGSGALQAVWGVLRRIF